LRTTGKGDSLSAGLDLLLTPGFRRHAVLEINAFGDLLPGIFHDGLDTYGAEVAQFRAAETCMRYPDFIVRS
jgi:hypothetical protein